MIKFELIDFMDAFQLILTDLWEFIKLWYWIPLMILYLSVIIAILIENGSPEKTIAWILVIVFLPVIGVLIYFFFGQKFNREKNFARIDAEIREGIENHWNELREKFGEQSEQAAAKIGSYSIVFSYLRNTKTAPTFFDDKIKLYNNGEEKFPAFLKAIRNAKKFIHLEYYIFELDQIGMEIIEILKQKTAEGVEVRVVTDDFGSPKLNRQAKSIFENTGVEYQTFLPVHFKSMANSNYRNHRKLLIVDAEIAFIGGINISDKYINALPYSLKNSVYWRDTSISVSGSSISLLQVGFWISWLSTNGRDFDIRDERYHYISDSTVPPNEIKSVISYAFTIPAGVPTAMESMILAISRAKHSIQICTPYFIPTDEFKSALMIAASGGVDIELMIPRNGDSIVVQQASLSFLKPLMKRGVKIRLYEKGFLHSKTMVIDDSLAFVGTVNLDTRSFLINFEATAVFYDKKVISQMKEGFLEDIKVSRLLTFEDWEKMGYFKKGFASICRLLAPIL